MEEPEVSLEPYVSTEPQIIEDGFSWQVRIAELTDQIRNRVLNNPQATRLEVLEAGRIIAACYGILVPEGLLHKLSTPTINEAKLKLVKYELYEQFFRDKERDKLMVRRAYLRNKIKKAAEPSSLIHPVYVRAWKKELVNLDRKFKKRKDKTNFPDEVIKTSQEETNKAMQSVFEQILSSQGGEEE
jgi:hypothetical protein